MRKRLIDLEAKLYVYILRLKEDINKEYSTQECEKNIVYIFKDNNEYKNYFIKNGVDTIDNELLKICKMKTTKKGNIIALKKLCDYAIQKYRTNNNLNQTIKNNPKEETNRNVYELNEEKLFSTPPEEIIYFLSLIKYVNGEAFLTLFKYFSYQIETNNISISKVKLLAQYLYNIKVYCTNNNDKENTIVMAKCTSRKLILEQYLDYEYIQTKREEYKLSKTR